MSAARSINHWRRGGATGVIATVLWGLFCANSWTWCIGMFLPVIMIERWGWPGFIVFAVPNVLGCAAFGYALRTRAHSEAVVSRHAPAMTWFSIITVAYQVFFVVFLFSALLPIFPDGSAQQAWMPLAAAGVVLGIGLVLSFLPDRDWLVLSVAVYVLALFAFVRLGMNAFDDIQWWGVQAPSALLWLTPTLVFGFALCPYLDLTFHRALQRSPSPHAFSVFGAAFFVMLLLTVAIWFPQSRVLPAVAIAHLLAQTIFTCGAHLREIRLSPAIADSGRRIVAMLAPVAAGPLLMITRLFSDAEPVEVGEQLYLRFLVFYGLVFPAYVLLMMRLQRPGDPSQLHPRVFAALMLLSLPAYEFGFIGGRTWLLVLPLALLLVVRALSRKRPPPVVNLNR